MKPTTVNDVIDNLEAQELHSTRQLARGLVAEYRKGTAIDPEYDFSVQPRELRQVVYDGIVRYSRRRWWSKLR